MPPMMAMTIAYSVGSISVIIASLQGVLNGAHASFVRPVTLDELDESFTGGDAPHIQRDPNHEHEC